MCSKIKQNKRIEVWDLGKLMHMSEQRLKMLYRTFIMLLIIVWVGLGVIRYTEYVNFGKTVGAVIEDHYDELVLYNELLGQVYRLGYVTEAQLTELRGYVSVVGLEDMKLIEEGYGNTVASDLLVVDPDDFSDDVYRAGFVTDLDSSDQLNLDVTGRDSGQFVLDIYFLSMWVVLIGVVGTLFIRHFIVFMECRKLDMEIEELRKRIVEIEQDEDNTEDLKSVLVRNVEEQIRGLEDLKVYVRNTSGV